MPLSDAKVRNARSGPEAYKMPDGHGLYLLVQPTGGRLWRWKYRFEGKEKLMSFGPYPDITLARARELHVAARQLLISGVDPMAQRKEDRTAEQIKTEGSFQTVVGLWLDHWQKGKSQRHVDYTRRRMEANIFPSIGARPVADIEAPEIVAMVRGIQDRGTREMAKRALHTTGQIFRYAVAHGHSKRNPATEIKPGDILETSRKVNYSRIDARELPQLLRAIEGYQGMSITRLAMKLMAMTFVRTGELIAARWSEFDFEEKRWDIPAERMKMRTPHIVPLARQAVEVLEILHDLTGKSEMLFPGDRNKKKPMSNNTILKALERMGYKGRMTGHGFRGLASTILHEKGYNHEHIELQLARAPRNEVSASYNHALYLEPRTKMMQDWADYLEQAQRGAKVLQMQATG